MGQAPEAYDMTSIIIPTFNAEKQICRLCEALRSQTASSEIIVVDSSSSDRTVEIAESFGARVFVIPPGDFDHGGTRTLAGNAAKGDILVYMTQDAIPFDNHSIENIARPFDDQGIAASFGRQLPYPDATAFGAHLRMFNYPDASCIKSLEDRSRFGIKTPFLSNSFAAYRKKALEEIGWFRSKLIMGEDVYAGARMLLAGYKIAYVSNAVVFHSHNYTVLQEFKRYFDIGVFHRSERWIIEEFGKAEGEGRRYMQSAFAFLRKNRKYGRIPEFCFRNTLKYIGYTLGQHYEKLPDAIRQKLSMHADYWAD
jgi:rhamnosyltransferase